jgi:glycosyltransferase involved in cell wall biosynthesis
VLIGPQEPQCRGFLSENRDPRLIAIEEVSQAEKCAWLKRCDLLCLPSRAESLGVVFLEAWAYRKPVVALRLPVLQRVISHGVDGLLSEHDSMALAVAINRLLENRPLASRMGLAGHAKLRHHYNWVDIGRRVKSIYRGLLEHTNRDAGVDLCISNRRRFAS